jgi:hypothetical protein
MKDGKKIVIAVPVQFAVRNSEKRTFKIDCKPDILAIGLVCKMPEEGAIGPSSLHISSLSEDILTLTVLQKYSGIKP